ncbi:putative defense protein 3 [Megalops cyprinoides]|uniref:putative defense protein 3 n=1 Tax=Megalops cyprinoides TaxID=118141 RepID=UPI0018646087|nr:putative defense protein 3 [Megalops cyprinoides]
MSARMGPLLLTISLLQLLSLGTCFPNGAPSSACEDMVPRHAGVQPQPSPAPYTIQTSSRTFQPGQPLTVTIKGPDYRGVLLEARTGTSVNALGSWQSPPADTKFLQCSGNPQGAITHSNTNLKGNSTVYSWIPPSGVNNIYFMATVAQQRTVFWLNVRSDTLTQGAAAGGIGLAAGGEPAVWAKAGLLFLVPCLLSILLHSR